MDDVKELVKTLAKGHYKIEFRGSQETVSTKKGKKVHKGAFAVIDPTGYICGFAASEGQAKHVIQNIKTKFTKVYENLS